MPIIILSERYQPTLSCSATKSAVVENKRRVPVKQTEAIAVANVNISGLIDSQRGSKMTPWWSHTVDWLHPTKFWRRDWPQMLPLQQRLLWEPGTVWSLWVNLWNTFKWNWILKWNAFWRNHVTKATGQNDAEAHKLWNWGIYERSWVTPYITVSIQWKCKQL